MLELKLLQGIEHFVSASRRVHVLYLKSYTFHHTYSNCIPARDVIKIEALRESVQLLKMEVVELGECCAVDLVRSLI